MNEKQKKEAATELRMSLDRVQHFVESQHYRGYEPFEGLSSWFRPLAFGNLLLLRCLQQLVRQSPVNIRPIMGVKKKESTKGRGYMAWGYLDLYKATGDASYLEKAEACLDWLDHHKAPKYEKHSWSNHFDFAGRGGMYTKDDPIIVWTSSIGQAYLEAYEQTGNERWLKITESVCGWLMDLPREETPTGNCLSYLAHTQSSIHNANMLGAALLARASEPLNKPDFMEVARSAMEYSCTRQLEDGSWWYAEDPRYHWFDNFHTGYNLDSLKCYVDCSGDTTWVPQLDAGLAFYKKHFFEDSGRPRYYHNRTYPVDSQCAGQAIETLARFSDRDPDCLDLAYKVARWTIENMQEKDGHFHYRHYPWGKAKTPMLHWSQAVIFKGMTTLYKRLMKTGARSWRSPGV